MSDNQNNTSINEVFDEIFNFSSNVTPEQKKDIKNIFVTHLVKTGKDISTPEKLKKELRILATEKSVYLEQINEMQSNISFQEFKTKLYEMLSNDDFSNLDEEFRLISDIFKKRDMDEINKTISLFDRQVPQKYVDSIKTQKKVSKFKLYVSEKIDKFRSMPPKDFKRYVIEVTVGVTLVVIVITSAASLKFGMAYEKVNQQNNVCVEYVVQSGIGNKSLNDMFYEYEYSYYAVKGAERNLSVNKGNPFYGDKVVGRTTKAEADELVEQGVARIISAKEAVDLLDGNDTLRGEFKRFANDKSDIVFYEPGLEKSNG